MTGSAGLTEDHVRASERVNLLDLEPVAYRLMHPWPDMTVMSLAEVDQVISAYRCFLKLCAWYQEEPLVPSAPIAEAWQAHITDTAKYAADCEMAFGRFVHHFPYFGLRGSRDEAVWRECYAATRALFRGHFGIEMPGTGAEASCHLSAILVTDSETVGADTLERRRPRPSRTNGACEAGSR